ncbi:MAG: MFS transporter [Acidobacteriota bacterium]
MTMKDKAKSPAGSSIAGRVPTGQLILFALPSFMIALMHGPMYGVLPGIYGKYFGVDLAVVGTVVLVSKLFDAVTDPVIGFLSDRTRTPIGARKPWLIAGAAVTLPGLYFLFSPPQSVTTAYYLGWSLVMYLGWTMSEIPYGAWTTELSRDYSERTRISLYRAVVALFGSLAMALAPLLPIFDGTEMTPEVLRWLAVVVVIALPITTAIAVLFAPVGDPRLSDTADRWSAIFASVRRNRPFQIFTIVYLIQGLGWGMTSSLSFIYFDTYLGIGDKISALMAPAILISLVALLTWGKIIKKIGKTPAWAFSMAGTGGFILAMAWIDPGPDSFLPYLLASCAMVFAIGGATIAPLAIIGDIVDYDILKTGVNRAGSYMALFTLAVKVNLALGSAVGFYLIDLFGYDPQGVEHGSTAILGLQLSYIYLPALLLASSSLIIWRFPLDQRRHGIVRRRLEAPAARET